MWNKDQRKQRGSFLMEELGPQTPPRAHKPLFLRGLSNLSSDSQPFHSTSDREVKLQKQVSSGRRSAHHGGEVGVGEGRPGPCGVARPPSRQVPCTHCLGVVEERDQRGIMSPLGVLFQCPVTPHESGATQTSAFLSQLRAGRGVESPVQVHASA